jgi:hypothetical protein
MLVIRQRLLQDTQAFRNPPKNEPELVTWTRALNEMCHDPSQTEKGDALQMLKLVFRRVAKGLSGPGRDDLAPFFTQLDRLLLYFLDVALFRRRSTDGVDKA